MKKQILILVAASLSIIVAQSAIAQDRQADFNRVRRENNAKAEARARKAFSKRHKVSPHRTDSQGNRNQAEFNRVRDANNAKVRAKAREAFAKGHKKPKG